MEALVKQYKIIIYSNLIMSKKTRVSKAVKNYVKAKLDADVEDKYFVTNQLNVAGVAGPVDNSAGSFQNLTGMVQGTTNITRLGNKINPKSLDVWVQARHTQIGVAGDTLVRVIIFMDHDLEAVQPTSAGVLNDTSIATNNFVIAPYIENNVPQRFTIMLDRLLKLELNGSPLAFLHHRFNKSDLRQITFGTNGAIIGKGTVRSLLLSQQADNDADIPEVGITSRLVYEDA